MQQFPGRNLSQINLLHHSLRRWELGDARAQRWGPPGEGHWCPSLHLSVLCPHCPWADGRFSTEITILTDCEPFYNLQHWNWAGRRADLTVQPPAALIDFTSRALCLGFHTISLAPSHTCEIKSYSFLIWLGPVLHPRDERLPYNVSNPVLHSIFTERQISHTRGKDKAWSASLLYWEVLKMTPIYVR